jgi:chromo domain-containing protein 1
MYQLLTSTDYIEQDSPVEPLSLIQDKFPILSERRIIAEAQPLDYFNRLAHSQDDANFHMIVYYAAMQADMRRNYRQFYVVHTEPSVLCAQQWKENVQTIAEVITPEQCIEELSKESKESKFDFLDWAMLPKEKELGDVPMEIEAVEHTAY